MAPMHPALALQCADSQIRISEAAPSPRENDRQWIELENTSQRIVDLHEWSLLSGDKKHQLSGLINPGQFFTVYFDKTLFEYERKIRLVDYAGREIDQWSWNEVKTGESIALSDEHLVITSLPTAGRPNVIVEGKNTNAKQPEAKEEKQDEPETGEVYLNEIFPNPSGSDADGEFVELINKGHEDINLSGWILSDAARDYTITEITIEAGQLLLLPRSLTSIALNNSSEKVKLTDPFGAPIDEFTYETSSEGYSFNRDEQEWYEALPSPGLVNNIKEAEQKDEDENNDEADDQVPEEDSNDENDKGTTEKSEEDESVDDKDEKKAEKNEVKDNVAKIEAGDWLAIEDGRDISVNGVLTVLPGTFQKRSAFIQSEQDDSLPAIELYFHKAAWPELQLYQQITVSGEKSISQKGHRLLIRAPEDIILNDVRDFRISETESFEELTALPENSLVTVAGTLIEQKKNSLVLGNNGDLLLIDLKPADLSLEELADESALTVTGIIKQKNEGPALWLRSLDDLIIEELKEPEEEKEGDIIAAALQVDDSDDDNQAGWLIFGSASTASVLLTALYRETVFSQARLVFSALKNKLMI